MLVPPDATWAGLPDEGRMLLDRVAERARGLLNGTLTTVRDGEEFADLVATAIRGRMR